MNHAHDTTNGAATARGPIPFHSALDDLYTDGHSCQTFSVQPIVRIDSDASPLAIASLHRARIHRAVDLVRLLLDRDPTCTVLDILYPLFADAQQLADLLHERLRAEASHG